MVGFWQSAACNECHVPKVFLPVIIVPGIVDTDWEILTGSCGGVHLCVNNV